MDFMEYETGMQSTCETKNVEVFMNDWRKYGN